MERDSGHNEHIEELAKRLGISVQQLDYWMMMGVLSPSLCDGQKGARRGFSSQDMEALRLLREFVPGGKQ